MIDFKLFFFLVLINIFFFYKNDLISEYLGIYDYPDFKRKIHHKKIACIGGFYLVSNLVFIASYNFFISNDLFPQDYFQKEKINFLFFLITFFVIFFIGIFDDKYGISANTKLSLFLFIFIFLIMADRDIAIKDLRFSFTDSIYDIEDYSQFFTIFCIIVFMNAFNMYDGSNLQVSLISIVIMLYLFLSINTFDYMSFAILIFLIFFSILNYKNKLFLGDNGSLTLSFLISYLLIKFYNANSFIYADEICLLLLMPVLDLTRLFVLRTMNGKSPLKSDKNHIHHLLLKKFSYKYTIIILFLIYFLPIIFSFIFEKYFLFILIQIFLYLSLLVLINRFNLPNVK
jgi:UDP-GlcNAc:undecaprenyl-phosphate GlcNAc-1-phosphate transferase